MMGREWNGVRCLDHCAAKEDDGMRHQCKEESIFSVDTFEDKYSRRQYGDEGRRRAQTWLKTQSGWPSVITTSRQE